MLVAYADPLLTRRTFVGRDIVPYNIPLESVVHDAWSRGRLPVWWDAVSGGRPLMPNPNAGVFYPLRPALAALPFPIAMRIFPVFHWILGGLGMLLLVRGHRRLARRRLGLRGQLRVLGRDRVGGLLQQLPARREPASVDPLGARATRRAARRGASSGSLSCTRRSFSQETSSL